MLSIEERIQALLPPRTLPVELNATGGTGIEKLIHGIRASGIIETHNPVIRHATRTQISTELRKLAGDHTLSRFIHKSNSFVEYNEHDFKIIEKDVGPLLMNDWDKCWNSLDFDSLESALDLWFKPNSRLFIIDHLNNVIRDLLNKFENDPVGYLAEDYTNRTRIGIHLQTSIDNTINYNRICDEFLKDYLASKGFGLIKLNAQALREDGFISKAEINKYVNSQVDMVLEQPNTENGFVTLSPGWNYAARSMTEGRLDARLGLRNGSNPQDDDRIMSLCAKTIDGKKKLTGLNINASFTDKSTDWTRQMTDNIRDLYAEQKKEDPDADPLGPWIRGINMFKMPLYAGTTELVTDDGIKGILNDSDRAYRDCINSLSLTDKKFWNSNILDILSKVKISKGSSRVKTLINQVKKRVSKNKKPRNKRTLTKTQEQNMKELITYIMESLIGMIGIMRGLGATNNLFTVREVVEQVKSQSEFRETFVNTLGISADEYIQLLDTDCMPESSMNHLLQGFIEEMSK